MKACQEHPKLVIKWRHHGFNIYNHFFFEKAIKLMVDFRMGRNSLPRLKADRPQYVDVTDEMLNRWEHFEGVDDVEGYASNLRIYPSLTRFDLTALKGHVDNSSS
jgi:hypothetical protein